MRKLPDLQQFCVMFFNYFVYFFVIFVILYYFVFFVNFGVSVNCGGLRNDHSALLSKEDSIISMVQQFSCSAGAHKK